MVDKNLWIMGSIGGLVALVAIAWFLYSADQDVNRMECAQENVERAHRDLPRIDCG